MLKRLSPYVLGFLSLLAACEEREYPLYPEENLFIQAPNTQVNPAEFAAKLQEIGNNNEVIIRLKAQSVPPLSEELLAQYPLTETPVLMRGHQGHPGPYRHYRGPAVVPNGVRQAVVRLIENGGGDIAWVGSALPVIGAVLPDSALLPLLAAIAVSPLVDYAEANRVRVAEFPLADPLGANPLDFKQTTHNVDDVWTYTRGEGVEIGVMDSGLAFDAATNEYHNDVEYFSSSPPYGVRARGASPTITI